MKPIPSRSPWIVVADRDVGLATDVANALRDRGYRAYSTARGLDAMRLALLRGAALAIVDVALLDMDGCDLVRQLRDMDSTLPVIMTTADFSPDTESRARQLGIVLYVHKPFDLHGLEETAARLFDSARRLCRLDEP
jgi:DNA-binding response OmpR family regulator